MTQICLENTSEKPELCKELLPHHDLICWVSTCKQEIIWASGYGLFCDKHAQLLGAQQPGTEFRRIIYRA